MKCFFCKGRVEDGVATDVTEVGNCVIVIRGVPCHKCTQCGEVTFDLIVGERLEQIVDNLKGSMMEVAIANYSDKVA